MTIAPARDSTLHRPLRLWPGVVFLLLQWLAWFGIPKLFPDAGLYGLFAGIFCGLAIILWWLFFSRAPWMDRILAIIVWPLAVFVTLRLVDKSIANGAMGMLLPIFSIPVICLAIVLAAMAGRRMSAGPRRGLMVVGILVACGLFTLIRTGGMLGEGGADLHWRWTETPEERLLAQSASEKAAAVPAPSQPAPPELAAASWPGFRGPGRDSVVAGVRIETNWSAAKPVELWRRPVGPGWSSFAVSGDRFYTQEQRGEEETVSCHNVMTGEPVWKHVDTARFWESNAGAGPRGTPTLAGDRVYTFGATGIVNVLNAADGSVVWTRNAATDTGAKLPGWGFSSSPLVVDDLVVIAAAGRLAGYEIATGNPRWIVQSGGAGYSSPHMVTIDGVPQILLLNTSGAIGVNPADGAELWKHAWPSDGIVQPAVLAGGDLLLGSGSGLNSGLGVRRISVGHASGGWTTAERWTSPGLKPYFNDFVVHKDHAFGFDGSMLACIDLSDGHRTWKGGRYGHGQLLLLSDQDVLLVLSEQGELALVGAATDQFTELARMPAIQGKTWNHPVLAGDVLLVRNGEEMTAFRLTLKN